LSDTLSWRKGRSAVIMGLSSAGTSSGISFQGIQTEARGRRDFLTGSIFAYGPGYDSGEDLALAFLTAVDRFSSGQLRRPDLTESITQRVCLFVQDDIKLNSRLSLNLGLRYEYFESPQQ
jgi:outer membrane receptor protein involved in Fe transport